MRMTARFSAIVGVALALLGSIGVARVLRRAFPASARDDYGRGVDRRALRSTDGTRTRRLLFRRPADLRERHARHGADRAAGRSAHRLHVLFDLALGLLVGGYSGFPSHTVTLMDGWKARPAPESIDFYRRAGATPPTTARSKTGRGGARRRSPCSTRTRASNASRPASGRARTPACIAFGRPPKTVSTAKANVRRFLEPKSPELSS